MGSLEPGAVAARRDRLALRSWLCWAPQDAWRRCFLRAQVQARRAQQGPATAVTSLPGCGRAGPGLNRPGKRKTGLTGLEAVNPAQHLRAGFSSHGVTVDSGKAGVGMRLAAYGHAGSLEPWVRPAPRRRQPGQLRAGALTEWYANGPLGIEQGFDVAARPAGAAGPLTLALDLSGNLAARLRNGSVLLTGPGATLRYGNLHATDARGRVLRSWLQLDDGRVLIRVADRGAAYPLRIDPLIQQGQKLTGAGGVGTGRVGYDVAVSADGNTALVGGRYGIRGAGAAWVFTRTAGVWSQQGGKLVGTGHTGEGELGHISEGEFGLAVALSADGNTALVGGPQDDSGRGAAWVLHALGRHLDPAGAEADRRRRERKSPIRRGRSRSPATATRRWSGAGTTKATPARPGSSRARARPGPSRAKS